MDIPNLIRKLDGYGISLTVEDSRLVTTSEKAIPQGISLTINAQEKQLVRYLMEQRDLQTSEPESNEPAPLAVPNWKDNESYRSVPIHLSMPMLESLMTWTWMYHELRIAHLDDLTLSATPENIRQALGVYPWGVVYITDGVGRFLILSWGSVPESALRELRDLETKELLVSEQMAA